MLKLRSVCAAAALVAASTANALIDMSSVLVDLNQASSGECEFEEIQLASDGTIQQRSIEMGERVTPNKTMNGTVVLDEYHFYHLCIIRHEHEHQINVNLTVDRVGGDASLFLSSLEKYPRRGHASWISQHPKNHFIKLYTYLDGFPRQSDAQNRSIALHIGVLGVEDRTAYNLTVSVLDLSITPDIQAREQYYTNLHRQEQSRVARRLRG